MKEEVVEKRMVEINGVKLELDMRTATMQRVDTFKVGDPVKVLIKSSYSAPEVKYAVIIGFDEFQSMPTIHVAYVDYNELKFVLINSKTEHEIIPVQEHDLVLEKEWIIRRMHDGIAKAELDLQEKKMKLEMFQKMFGKYFENKEAAG